MGLGKEGNLHCCAGIHLSTNAPTADTLNNFLEAGLGSSVPLSLPKINFFFSVLMHKKVLTGDNLIKRGIIGPHRCSLCWNTLETIEHLFVYCTFAQEVWTLLPWPQHHYSIADLNGNSLLHMENVISSCNPKQVNMEQNLASNSQICMLEIMASQKWPNLQ